MQGFFFMTSSRALSQDGIKLSVLSRLPVLSLSYVLKLLGIFWFLYWLQLALLLRIFFWLTSCLPFFFLYLLNFLIVTYIIVVHKWLLEWYHYYVASILVASVAFRNYLIAWATLGLMFQYSFPPSSVGEVGRMGAPSRREIGHGRLAERSLERILPSDDNFPYTIRVESTITESNGSSRWEGYALWIEM